MFHKILRLVLNILFFSPRTTYMRECICTRFFLFTTTTETGTLRSVTKLVPFPSYMFPLGGFYGTLNGRKKKVKTRLFTWTTATERRENAGARFTGTD
jgi:hypothetical protein